MLLFPFCFTAAEMLSDGLVIGSMVPGTYIIVQRRLLLLFIFNKFSFLNSIKESFTNEKNKYKNN